MNGWKLFRRSCQWKINGYQEGSFAAWKSMSGFVIACSCLYILGCDTAPEPVHTPSKQEIQTDADRFFEKMEREKQGKPAPQN